MLIKDVQIIIDPGHGGSETGAVTNGYKEKNLNLQVGLELKNILKVYFLNVQLTQEDDSYYDLTRRAAWVAKKAAEFKGRTICLSIHFNAFNGQARGVEVIYSIHSDDKLAKCIANKICELGLPLRRVFSKESEAHPGTGQDYYCMHRQTGSAQTVIIESLFIDSPDDAAFLKQPDFIKKLAQKQAEGLLEYLQIPEEPAKVPEPKPVHKFKADNDELLAAGILNNDHSNTLDNPASEGFVIALINRLRKVGN